MFIVVRESNHTWDLMWLKCSNISNDFSQKLINAIMTTKVKLFVAFGDRCTLVHSVAFCQTNSVRDKSEH